jgi:hypothetical protein
LRSYKTHAQIEENTFRSFINNYYLVRNPNDRLRKYQSRKFRSGCSDPQLSFLNLCNCRWILHYKQKYRNMFSCKCRCSSFYTNLIPPQKVSLSLIQPMFSFPNFLILIQRSDQKERITLHSGQKLLYRSLIFFRRQG